MSRKVFYQCDSNDYCRARLCDIRDHIRRLSHPDRLQYDGDYIYKVVNGVVDLSIVWRIDIRGGRRVRIIFRNVALETRKILGSLR